MNPNQHFIGVIIGKKHNLAEKDNVKEKVFTENKVVFITEQNDTLHGIGFESDVELNNWKILKPTGIFKVENNEK